MLRHNKSLITKAILFLLILIAGIVFLINNRERDVDVYDPQDVYATPQPVPTPLEYLYEPEYPLTRQPITSPAGLFECSCPRDNENMIQELALRRYSQDRVQVYGIYSLEQNMLLLETDGTLWSWGNNTNGQIGDGSMVQSSAPIQILDSVIYVSPNGNFAIRDDNSLWGWGLVFDETQQEWPHVRPVKPMWLMDDVHAVFNSDYRDFVLRTDGSLWALDDDRRMQAFWDMRTVPDAESDAVHILGSVVDVYHAQHFSIALQCNGRLWAIRGTETSHMMDEVTDVYLPHMFYGTGHPGNILLRQTDSSLWSVRPTLGRSPHIFDHLMDNVASVNRFGGTDFILQNDGTLWAMGSNTSGRLGDGTRIYRHEPIQIKEDVIYVNQSWGDTVFAITSDGSLWGWGSNAHGQMGYIRTNRDQLYPVLILDNARAIYQDFNTAFAIDYDDNLWVWGGNAGVMGHAPMLVKESISQVYLMNDDIYVLDKSGGLWVWEIRFGEDMSEHTFEHVLGNVSYVIVNDSRFLMNAIQTDGSIWAWGNNWEGMVGDGTTTHRNRHVNITYAFSYIVGNVPLPLGLNTVDTTPVTTQALPTIVTNGDSTFYIDANNHLWAWGANWNYQLGHDYEPAHLWGPSPPGFVMDEVIYVHSDGGDTYALRSDGSLWAWGREHGRTPIQFMQSITAFYADFENYFALGVDGTLWQWERFTASPIIILEGVRSFYLDNRVFFALMEDDSLMSWGLNPMGVLGDGSEETTAGGPIWFTSTIDWDEIEPVRILENVSSFYLDGFSAFAIQTDGNLWAWGNNTHGQLGDGTRISRNVPVNIMDGVKTVIPSQLSTFAIRATGDLWAWGYNAMGQLGDRTQISRLRPTRIMRAPRLLAIEMGTTFAILEDNRFFAWGMGFDPSPLQQLANASSFYVDTVTGEIYILLQNGNLQVFHEGRFTQVDTAYGVATLFIRWGTYYIVLENGDVWGWGSNWNGQLGEGELWITRDDMVLVFGY